MWRGWRVIVPIVLVSAVLQAALTWPAYSVDRGWLFLLLAALSGLVLLVAFGLIAATALRVADGRVGWATAQGALRAHGLRYLLWSLGLTLVVLAGLTVYRVPGIVVVAVTPFLLLAALDGASNPLAVNFRVIGRRFWRWLVTVLIMAALLVVSSLGAGFFTFFVRTPLAALVVWLVGGFVMAWWTTAWALIYRNALAGPSAAPASGPEPSPVPAEATSGSGAGAESGG